MYRKQGRFDFEEGKIGEKIEKIKKEIECIPSERWLFFYQFHIET